MIPYGVTCGVVILTPKEKPAIKVFPPPPTLPFLFSSAAASHGGVFKVAGDSGLFFSPPGKTPPLRSTCLPMLYGIRKHTPESVSDFLLFLPWV